MIPPVPWGRAVFSGVPQNLRSRRCHEETSPPLAFRETASGPPPLSGESYSRPAGAAGSPDRGCEAEARQRMGCRRHSADVGPALGRLCCPSQGRARTLVRAAQPPLKGEGDRAAVERSLHEMTGVRVLRQFRFPGFRLRGAGCRTDTYPTGFVYYTEKEWLAFSAGDCHNEGDRRIGFPVEERKALYN